MDTAQISIKSLQKFSTLLIYISDVLFATTNQIHTLLSTFTNIHVVIICFKLFSAFFAKFSKFLVFRTTIGFRKLKASFYETWKCISLTVTCNFYSKFMLYIILATKSYATLRMSLIVGSKYAVSIEKIYCTSCFSKSLGHTVSLPSRVWITSIASELISFCFRNNLSGIDLGTCNFLVSMFINCLHTQGYFLGSKLP